MYSTSAEIEVRGSFVIASTSVDDKLSCGSLSFRHVRRCDHFHDVYDFVWWDSGAAAVVIVRSCSRKHQIMYQGNHTVVLI